MRKYLKPAIEMEKFDVEDVITESTGGIVDIVGGGDGITEMNAGAPIMVDFN